LHEQIYRQFSIYIALITFS